MDDNDLALVTQAFERLIGHVLASHCDPEYARVIHMAGADIIAILSGEWDKEPDAQPDEPDDAFMFDVAMSIGPGLRGLL